MTGDQEIRRATETRLFEEARIPPELLDSGSPVKTVNS